MAEYIELTEELILSMRAGAKAISNTKKYHGTIYMYDAFSDNPKEMPYLQAAEILYAASEKESADVTLVWHCRAETLDAQHTPDRISLSMLRPADQNNGSRPSTPAYLHPGRNGPGASHKNGG